MSNRHNDPDWSGLLLIVAVAIALALVLNAALPR